MDRNKSDNLILMPELKDKLSSAYNDLAGTAKSAMFMRYHEGLSDEEIGKVLNVSIQEAVAIMEVSEEYFIEETGEEKATSYLARFFKEDMKEQVGSASREILPTRKTGRRIGFKRIAVLAASLMLASTFIALAMTAVITSNQEDELPATPDTAVHQEKNGAENPEKAEDEEKSTEAAVQPEISSSNPDVQGKTGTIVFSGNHCDCGHVNPKSVEITGLGSNEQNFSWEITNSGTEKVVDRDSGKDISARIASLHSAKKDGNYVLNVKYDDKEGNIVYVKKAFVIDSGHIDENQYR